MPNKAQDHVYRLICSMNPAEKRYFKLHTSRHAVGSRSNYQVLFDAIGDMDHYDERILLERFKGAGFTRRFAIAKRRLYETILRSLDAYHTENSLDSRLRRMIHEVEILHDRALYDEARKHLTSVRKLAREHDRLGILFDVNEWDRRIMERTNYAAQDERGPGALVEHARSLHAELMELEDLWGLKSRTFLNLYRQGKVRGAVQETELHELLGDPLLSDARGLRSARARYLFHHVHAAAAFALGDLHGSDTHLQANHTLLSTLDAKFNDAQQLLFSVLSNRIYIMTLLGEQAKATALLKEFKQIPLRWKGSGSPDLDNKVFATATSLELALLARTGDFAKAVNLMPRIQEGLTRHGNSLSPLRRESLFLQLAYVHFGAGQYETALRWSHRQLHETGVEGNQETQLYGRILNLLIQLELDKRDLLTYTLRNITRLPRSRMHRNKVESIVLSFLKERLKVQGRSGAVECLKRFRARLEELANDRYERVLFEHIDLIAWVDAKLSGKPLDKTIKERAGRVARAA